MKKAVNANTMFWDWQKPKEEKISLSMDGSYEHYSYILMLSSKTIPKVDFWCTLLIYIKIVNWHLENYQLIIVYLHSVYTNSKLFPSLLISLYYILLFIAHHIIPQH